MIPYIPQPTLQLGPLHVYSFGVLVALGIFVGVQVLKRRAVREGLDLDISGRMLAWVLVGGFLGAHLVDRLVYFPSDTLADPWSLLRIWEGLSSFGGFLGAVVGAALFLRRHRARLGGRAWRYVDAIAYALPFGWTVGRFGCFLAFDHPGKVTTFFLGQRYTDGFIRHNLGLEEALYMIPVTVVIAALGQRSRPAGFFAGLLAVLYAPVRFLLEFLRIVDVRYAGLTPGQYGAIALFVAGVILLIRCSRVRPAAARAREDLGQPRRSPARALRPSR
ncbi:prolipoprotein diacylglyceryl transferase [Sorangium sp. So ce119]|uniref:prolipoprotein diacylglyceryl transferase n=1 Tax=Sorangium sp. So ce119 TaxID=3133279 RepID=UPI003F5DDEB1